MQKPTQQLTVTASEGYQASLNQTTGFADSITVAGIAAGGSATFWTRPVVGLPAGTHTGIVIVTNTSAQSPPLTMQTRAVSFTVNPLPVQNDDEFYENKLYDIIARVSTNQNFNITVTNGRAKGIPSRLNTSALSASSEITAILNADGTPRTAALIGTGTRIMLSNGTEFEVIVFGDTNGTGEVTIADINRVASHFRGRSHLQGANFVAADLNRNGNISIAVLNRIVGYFRGRIDSLS